MNFSSNKKLLGIAVALATLAISYAVPPTEVLTHEGAMGLGVLAAGVSLWVCGSFPIGVSGLAVLAAGALMGVAPLSAIFSGFGSSTTLFMIAVFSMTAAFSKSFLSKRLVGAVARWADGDSRRLVLGIMALTAFVSMFMTDTAVIALFYGLSLVLIEGLGSAKHSNFAKCLYIGIPFAGITGGIATPAGNSTNVLVAGLLESTTGQPLSFLGWMIIGVPLAAVMLGVLWLSLVTIFKPESIDPTQALRIYGETSFSAALQSEEKKTLAMMLIVPLLWIASTWIPVLNPTIVCIIAFAVLLAPGFNLLTFDEYQSAVPWNVIFMVGSVVSIGSLLGSTGGAQFLGDLVLSTGVSSLGVTGAFLIIGVLLYALHTLAPIGPGFIPVFFLPLVTLCASADVNPIAAALLLAGITGGNYLLPINPTLAITYRQENYSISDMAKVGAIPTIVLIALMALWVPFMTDVLSDVGMLQSFS